jgi:hypothetical protein
MQAAARMEWTGTPCDVETLTDLRTQWDVIRHRLAREVNRSCGVFVPTGTVLDPHSRVGAAVLRTAAARDVDPYHLAAARSITSGRKRGCSITRRSTPGRRPGDGPDSRRRRWPAGKMPAMTLRAGQV